MGSRIIMAMAIGTQRAKRKGKGDIYREMLSFFPYLLLIYKYFLPHSSSGHHRHHGAWIYVLGLKP
jgi:hypothetical protein